MIKYILYLHLWLAFIALLLSTECILFFSIPNDFYPFACFSATATLFAYNAHTLVALYAKKKTTELTSWASKHFYSVLFTSLIGLVGSVYLSIQFFSITQWGVLIAAGFIWILYESVIAFVNTRAVHINKNYSLLKSLVLAFVWTVMTIVLPLSSNEFSVLFEVNVLLFVLIRFCLFALITQLFEYRDLYADKVDFNEPKLLNKALGYTNLTLVCNLLAAAICMQLLFIDISISFKATTILQLIIIVFYIRIKNIITITPSMLLWDGILILTPLCNIPLFYL
jgi:hypothetical protein